MIRIIWIVYVGVLATMADGLRGLWYLWNRTHVLFPRHHSSLEVNIIPLLSNLPSLKYLEYDLEALDNPAGMNSRYARLQAEDYIRNRDAYFFRDGKPTVSPISIILLWETLRACDRRGGGSGEIPMLDGETMG